MSINTHQPPPKKGTVEVWPLVVEDMKERNRIFSKKYGTPLMTNNDRDSLVDAYQEALDLCVYLRQAIEERKNK